MEFDLKATFDGLHSWVPAIPFRDGYLAIQQRRRNGRFVPSGYIGNSGLYRFDPMGKHEKLIGGTVRPWAVSPDGCRVAVGIDERDYDDGSERLKLKLLHVCKGT
jgi:hypothetical protein